MIQKYILDGEEKRGGPLKGLSKYFGAFVVDEAHLLQDRTALETIGAALIGIHAKRTIALTSTPHCNNSSDVAAIMSIVDIKHESATSSWVEKILLQGHRTESAKEWRRHYLLRRGNDVMISSRPLKQIGNVNVEVFPAELAT